MMPNYEYYCMTMLTVFKPWRSGHTLKSDSQSWTEAFNAYKFNAKDIQLMKNFNLRYECLDARDDFHATLKRQNRAANKLNRKLQTDSDSDSDSDSDPNDYTDRPKPVTKVIGQDALKRENHRKEILSILS